MRVDPVIVVLGAFTGLVMGLLTSLVGLSPGLEPAVWVANYGVWLWMMQRRATATPFPTAVAASLASGVVVGTVQAALLPAYIASNPWYASYMSGTRASLGGQMVVQGVGMGMLFGVAVGLVARGMANRRAST